MSSALGACTDAFPDKVSDAGLLRSRCVGKEDGVECARKFVCIAEECVPEKCGDGHKTGAEECDDGNTDDGDDCPATYTSALCGNGETENAGVHGAQATASLQKAAVMIENVLLGRAQRVDVSKEEAPKQYEALISEYFKALSYDN